MENELKLLDQSNIANVKDFIKLDFPGQNLKGNKSFEDFKKEKLTELGKDAKLFYCKKDNLYFYISKEQCKTPPLYYKNCPLCNNFVCYFCKRNTSWNIVNRGNCCLKLKLYYLFFHSGFQFLKHFDQLNEEEKQDFRINLILSYIPFFGFVKSYVLIFDALLFGALLKDKKYKNDLDNLVEKTYNRYINEYYSEIIIVLIILFTGILLSFCFTIYDIYFKLFIMIISLFSKFIPLRYYLGIMMDD